MTSSRAASTWLLPGAPEEGASMLEGGRPGGEDVLLGSWQLEVYAFVCQE